MVPLPPAGNGTRDAGAVRLLRRLLVQRYGPDAYREPMLLLGRLPDGLRTELPVPEGAEVLGSAIHNDHLEIALDTPLDANAALEWYRDHLGIQAWRETELNPPSDGGFTYSNPSDRLLFCAGDAGPLLIVRALATPTGSADVRLVLRAEAGVCNPRHAQQDTPPLPVAGPPPRGRHRSGGHSGGGDGIESHAHLVAATLDLDAVAQHYSAVLERAGWERVAGDRDGAVAWASWSFADGRDLPCQGTLLATRHPLASDTYLLDLYAVRVGDATSPSLFEPGYPTAAAVSEPQDAAQFSRLAQRLLTSAVAYDEAPEGVQLYPGTLPPGLDGLPLPPDGQIVGGMTSQLHAIGLVAAAGSVEATLESYRTALPAAGWVAHSFSPRPLFEQGGFAHVGPHPRLLYSLEGQTELTVEAYELPGGGTEVRLDRQLIGASWRYPLRPLAASTPYLVPLLLPPGRGEQHGGGSGNGPTSARYGATLKSELDLEAVLDHYARQLEAHGWSAAAQGQDGALGWRSWARDFGGQRWDMLLYAIRRPDREDTYILHLEGDAR